MPNPNPCDPIAKLWIRDAQHLWQIQENLLQSYRTYLIVLNSLLAAGSCTIMVRLYSEIAGTPRNLNVAPLKLVLIVIMISLLASFIVFAFRSIVSMGRVISNRGYNGHLCQYVIIKLQLGELFREVLPDLKAEDLAKMSLLSAFKTVEHPKRRKGFVCLDKNHARLGDFLWRIKNTECKTVFNNLDFTRRNISRLLTRMFLVIWGLISLFWLLAAGWLIYHALALVIGCIRAALLG